MTRDRSARVSAGPSDARPAIAAVLFDLGGTLIDERDPIAWAAVAERLGLRIEPEAIVHAYEAAEAAADEADAPPTSERLWTDVLAAAAGAPVDAARVATFVEELRGSAAAPLVFSDVPACLEALGRDGRRLGIVSNSRSEAHVRAVLAHGRLSETFELVVSSGTEGIAKPNPEIFRRAVARLGLPPGRVAHVGDQRRRDALAARAAGLEAIWLNRAGTGYGTDPPEITSLSELPPLLRERDAVPVK